MKVAHIAFTCFSDIVCNCNTCKHGFYNPYRKLPVCRLGIQLDCIQDNYDHWTPKDTPFPRVEVIEYIEVKE